MIGSSGPVFSFPSSSHSLPPSSRTSSSEVTRYGLLGSLILRRRKIPEMSRQHIATLRLTLSTLFLTFLIIASLFANFASSPHRSQTLLPPPTQHHHDGDPHRNGGVLDALAEMATKSFSESWAYYSPYHPAAPFEGSMREGCAVSQVNIVSPHFLHAAPNGPALSMLILLFSSNATALGIPPPEQRGRSPPRSQSFKLLQATTIPSSIL